MKRINTTKDVKTIEDLVRVNEFKEKFANHEIDGIETTPQMGGVISFGAPLLRVVFDGKKMSGKEATVLYHCTKNEAIETFANHTEEEMIQR